MNSNQETIAQKDWERERRKKREIVKCYIYNLLAINIAQDKFVSQTCPKRFKVANVVHTFCLTFVVFILIIYKYKIKSFNKRCKQTIFIIFLFFSFYTTNLSFAMKCFRLGLNLDARHLLYIRQCSFLFFKIKRNIFFTSLERK